MEKTFVIRKLIPELSADYFDFFDHLAFSDNSPMQPCYCCNFNLMEDEQNRLMEEYEKNGLEAYRVELRKAAERLVADNSLQGYLIYDGEKAVGWCNANDKSNYTAYGFNESIRGSRNVRPGYVKAVLYSETILSGQPKKRRLPPSYFFRRFIWLSRKAYAATTGTSQPSAFNFLRYALILRSLLN